MKRTIAAPQLKVTIRNVGRDSVYLAAIGGASANGAKKFERFLNDEGHIALAAGEPNTVVLEKHLTVAALEGGLAQRWTRMWVKDISGKRFYVSNSAECLSELWRELD